ncbi:LacI family DNA-binding transcriptional regulator [Aquimarina sp. 2201CG14-23]|uniref:LacI family DNA-binding transcriptional regulator n=1 Tax=Aquimarina mycalae TaxID=3040073 RepID=UPI002477E66E|nr:LacI family DNA-binding transcriptional regulator [Aquimarina sp. 2201CG14-23]MDH7444202.1 LacI family DNA-binding transcriptional regulator [Aquimarina sp. 2201CG14-23]
MKQKVTLKQIAKELDVSISTVSKALKDSVEISLDTRQKVKAFAKLYNYKPNNIALSLKNRKTKTIGVIIPEIVHHFFTTVIGGVEKVANEKGYNVIICSSNNSFDKEVINMEMLASGSADGFILSVAKETQQKKDYHHIEETMSQGMPVVLFDRIIDELVCDKVIIDDGKGAQAATNHLLSLGCKKIAILTTVDYISVGKLRTNGYLRALRAYDITAREDYILKIEDIDNCESEISEFLKNKDVDAIFAVNELFAVTAAKVLDEQGKKIPDDVSIVGFTDGILSKHFIPSLTTISQHGEEMGVRAAKLLIEKLEGDDNLPEEYKTVIIDTSLIQRQSTKK